VLKHALELPGSLFCHQFVHWVAHDRIYMYYHLLTDTVYLFDFLCSGKKHSHHHPSSPVSLQ